ncbi:MAG: hypothetical protein KY461_06860 [Actinobacteria bacterium]|nr:hypothetical protein [Actinomycetota bacterium]
MNALYVASLVVTGLIVVALAVALLTILFLLWRTSDTLGKVIFGVRAIAHRVSPVEELLTGVNGDLSGIRAALHDAVPDPSPEGEATEAAAQQRTVHS